MNYEENRLATFGCWPTTAVIEPIRVAKAGFYYTGLGLEVQCFSCGGKISDWHYGDQAMDRHRRLDPRCPFVVDPGSSGNVALVLNSPDDRESDRDSNSRSPTLESDSVGSSESYMIDGRPSLDGNDEIYRNDALRLLSFINWPVRFISRESLASAGFYHAGGGRVRCAWCGGELRGGWRLGDRPLEEHRRHFPHCEYARRAATVPPPVDTQPETPPVRSPRVEQRDTPQTCSEAVEHNTRVLDSMPWHALGVVGGTDGAKHLARASYAERLASFYSWPPGMSQTPEMLAEAGFFYTGSGDQVICFYCGGGLGRWEPSDLPWREHARWFPDCGFVLLLRGREDVDRCRNAPQNNCGTYGNSQGRNVMSNNRVEFPVTEAQIDNEMESPVTLAALGTGLGVTRIRTAIRRRLKNTGCGFATSEALIDSALNEQLNEQSWSASPRHANARDILAETLRTLRTAAQDTWERSAQQSPPAESRPPAPVSLSATPQQPEPGETRQEGGGEKPALSPTGEGGGGKPAMSLEEENRQLKEARLCKVCMDSEVSAVLLPCGHAVSCAACAVSLSACPLCRYSVRALVRAYLA